MIIDLTGMELANASLLDEATATAEAMTMSRRLSKVLPTAFSWIRTVTADHSRCQNRAHSLGYEVIVADPFHDLEQHNFFALIVQYPVPEVK